MLAACAAWSTSATAASFDCGRAGTPIEATVCDVPALSQLDDRLGALYADLSARDPDIKTAQRQWLAQVRDRCEDQACLQTAYEHRIHELETAASTPVDGLALMMDVTWFYGLPDLGLEHIVTNPDGVLFRKRIVEWTDQDFALLEQRLRQQIGVERDAAAARQDKIREMGYQAHPVDEDHDYSFRKGVLDKVIAAIPKYKYLINETRKKAASDAAAAETEKQKQQALHAEEETRQAAAAQLREQQQAQAEEQRTSSNKGLLVLGFIAAVVGAWVWNKFFRLRCARCKSTGIDTQAVAERDRWRGTKKVTEQTTRGSKTRHVSTTYVKNQYHYQCRECGEDWTVLKKEEL